jgi:triosephosphate isomerase
MNPSRGIVVAGNWKMNHGPEGTRQFARDFESQIDQTLSNDTKKLIHQKILKPCIFAPAISLMDAQIELFPMGIHIGAQEVSHKPSGAYTGEISVSMLKEIHIYLTLVGHSERRQYHGETDAKVNEKINYHLSQNCKVVWCIGETKEERLAGRTLEVLQSQLTLGLKDIPKDTLLEALKSQQLMIAYEPVWAIGTGLTATPAQAEEAHAFIRQWLSTFDKEASARSLILYGGSVTPENFKELLECPNVDGGLVGGASLKAQSYAKLLQIAGETLSPKF